MVKRSDPYIYTRGEWKHNELVWAVLAVLDVTKRAGYPLLRALAIWKMTGCNYKTLRNSLPKWVEWSWIKRNKPIHCQAFVKPVYTYRITQKGKRRMFKMEMPQQRDPLAFKLGVRRDAVLARLPLFRKENR